MEELNSRCIEASLVNVIAKFESMNKGEDDITATTSFQRFTTPQKLKKALSL